MDVDAVDLLGINRYDGPRHALSADLVVKAFALRESARLGIGNAVDAAIGMEDDGAGHHGTGKTAAANFVNACHRHETVAVEAVFNIAAGRYFCHGATISRASPALPA